MTMSRNITIAIIAFTMWFTAPAAWASDPFDWSRGVSSAGKLWMAYSLTEDDLREYASQEVAQMDKANKVCSSSSDYARRLKRITEGMTDANGVKLNFKVYKTSDLNAFACPDGSVRVFSGLMDLLSDEELLGVIGHEIGHVAMKHTFKAWKSALKRSAANDAAGAMSDTYALVSDSYLGDICSLALSSRFSRKQETEADDYGYRFLKKSGKNPWALVIAFEKMKELSESGSGKYKALLQMFSSHPDFDKRISRLSSKAKADGFSRPTSARSSSSPTSKSSTKSTSKSTSKKKSQAKSKR